MDAIEQAKHKDMQIKLGLLVGFVAAFDGLDDFIEKLDRALDIGPLLDPTLYIKKGGKAEEELRLARATQDFRDKLKEIMGDHWGNLITQIELMQAKAGGKR